VKPTVEEDRGGCGFDWRQTAKLPELASQLWRSRRFREGGNVADGFVHTVHRDGRWRNFIEGEQDWLRGAFRSKETAVVAGAVEARHRRTRHVIHDEDDSVIELNAYSDNRGARAA
jgi:Uncharacterized protein conserved in bacteria (DUF2188)